MHCRAWGPISPAVFYNRPRRHDLSYMSQVSFHASCCPLTQVIYLVHVVDAAAVVEDSNMQITPSGPRFLP